MSSVFYSSKEEIRNRIVKRAQELWGIDKEYDFDPIVVLIMEAISAEVFNISNEVKNLDNRIFDKFSRILAPDNLVAPRPAHGVIYVEPIDAKQSLSKEAGLIYKKKMPNSISIGSDQNIQLSFSALENTKLFKGKVKCMVTPSFVYDVNGNQRKIVGKNNNKNLPNSLFLGIQCEDVDKQGAFENLNFFFNWGNYQVPKEKYHLLSLCKWAINGYPIKAYRERFMNEGRKEESSLFERKQFMYQLTKDIEAIYTDRFLTIEAEIQSEIFQKKQEFPSELENKCTPPIVDTFSSELDWVRIDFPAAITPEDLDELMVQINAVPVVNKRLFQAKNRLKVLQNIIPIRTDDMEQMLTVHKILDKDGMVYSEVPYENDLKNDEVGYYSVRSGGTERLDTRSAKDYIDYLFELLRDEKAAFSTYNADFLNNALNDLDKSIMLIHQKSKQKAAAIKEQYNYIVLKPKNENDLVFVDVWLTYGDLANGIPANESLHADKQQLISNFPVVFLMGTKGGRQRLTRSESVEAFKYGLITADKIVTKNDIISFMKYELGDRIQRVEIKKGVQRSTSITQALQPTIDIVLETNSNDKLTIEEWEDVKEQLLSKLNVRSTMEQNYRILLQ